MNIDKTNNRVNNTHTLAKFIEFITVFNEKGSTISTIICFSGLEGKRISPSAKYTYKIQSFFVVKPKSTRKEMAAQTVAFQNTKFNSSLIVK